MKEENPGKEPAEQRVGAKIAGWFGPAESEAQMLEAELKSGSGDFKRGCAAGVARKPDSVN